MRVCKKNGLPAVGVDLLSLSWDRQSPLCGVSLPHYRAAIVFYVLVVYITSALSIVCC